MLDIGLNRIIFDNNIHSTDVMTHNMTPPHPKSSDQDVENILAASKSRISFAPCLETTPSMFPAYSALIFGRLCIRLKWIIVNVNRANDAETKK